MGAAEHVLVVDDDRGIRELVGSYLEKQGLRCSVADGGRAMWSALQQATPDLILLDIMLPGDDGLVLCRALRTGRHRAIPIVMLSARSDETDRVIGLELGADDYIAKPFAVRELLARIRTVLRRTRMLPPNLQITDAARLLAFGDWRLDTTGRHLVDPAGVLVALGADLFDRSVDLLVSRLRQRLGDDAREPRYIKTLRSEGYVFSAAVTIVEARS